MSIKTRAQELIDTLQLHPHPEGGWFREEFRSISQVQPLDAQAQRSALTAIYFLLESHQHSHWHRVSSDEVWVYLEGDTLNLWSWDALNQGTICTRLGPVEINTNQRPQHTIAAELWQAAWPSNTSQHGYTLVACMVGPGFDFSDFTMLEDNSDVAVQMRLAGLPGC